MTDPRNPDDSWGELYRELGVDDPDAPKAAPGEEPPPLAEEYEVLEVVELTETDPDEAAEEVAEVEPAEGAEGEGEPGQKKRRRRRRRRKKKGAAAAGEEAGGVEGDAEEAETQLEEDDEAPETNDGPAFEEEVSPEATRDIIANWNVPSWEEIVAGLHRPER
jgi:ribonuclease E